MKPLTFLLALLGAAIMATAQPLEIRPNETVRSRGTATMRISPDSGFPLVVYGTDYHAGGSTPEEMARQFLRERGGAMGISESEVSLVAVRKTPGGFRVRFEQVISGLPVYRSDIVISLSNAGRVAFVVNGFKQDLQIRPVATKSASAASAIARSYLAVVSDPELERVTTVVYPHDGGRIAHKVEIMAPESILGAWEILVDAESGEIFRVVNRATEHEGRVQTDRQITVKSDKSLPNALVHAARIAPMRVDGTGWVFDPDPLSRARTVYGGAFSDNGDADSPELTAQLVEVALRDITFDGTTYFLEGPYARIHDNEAPHDGVFSQTSPDWHFTRGQDAFEAVNAYHHIDQSLRYINETLGFSLMPYQYTGGVLIDPHGRNGIDNSGYLPFNATMSFGEGGVDDAEDPDVLLHELGHGLHDWVTNGGASRADGLSEGSGDYWANSYSRSLGYWGATDHQRSWMGHWVSFNEFGVGRTTSYEGHYPEDLVGRIHTDGQIWSSSLMEIWERLGRETTDLLFLEALSMTGSSSSQADAAFALIQADTLLYDGANSDVIRDVFLRRGYLVGARFSSEQTGGPPPLTVAFSDDSFAVGSDVTSWAWDFDDDGVIDATGPSPEFTYQEAGLYAVALTVGANNTTSSIRVEDYISVNQGVYVWEGGPRQFERSGRFLQNLFETRGIGNAFSDSEKMHAPLVGYDAVFLSLGSLIAGATALDESMASALTSYLEAGGNVYLEGSGPLAYDQTGREALLAVFGVSEYDGGSFGETPVQNLAGQSGALTEGMLFSGSTQLGNDFIDSFTPRPPAVTAFLEPGLGAVGIQHELAGGGRAFVFSFALGHLVDAEFPSTRAELAGRILDYFGISAGPTSVQDDVLAGDFRFLSAFPNPFSGSATLRYELAQAGLVEFTLYNALGQRVAVLDENIFREAGVHALRVDASLLPSGTYFARLESSGAVVRSTLTIVH